MGSHVVDRLIESGKNEIRVLVRKTSDLRWLEGKPIEKVYGDVTQPPEELTHAVRGQNQVFHLAGITKGLRKGMFHRVNSLGTENLIRACLAQDTPPDRFVLVSSAAAIGPPSTKEPLNESKPPHPLGIYGRSKLEAELIAQRHMSELPISILRPTATYGPRDPEFLPIIKAAQLGFAPQIGFTENRFSLCHVRDVAQAVVLAGAVDGAASEAFLIGGQNSSQTELNFVLAQIMGKKRLIPVPVPRSLVYIGSWVSGLSGQIVRQPRMFSHWNIRRLLARNWTIDISKARDKLGYEPEYNLMRGMQDTVDWYLRQGLL